jgi:cleavage and polyadenylation specificity factor subunit 3
MLDCGIHPGRTGDDALPFFDSGPDASEIDLILISHFHLDHAASLPYFTEKVQVWCGLLWPMFGLHCLYFRNY